MNPQLIYPMFALVCLTVVVLMTMFLVRVRALRTGQVKMKYYRVYEGQQAPELVTRTGRHFVNLFEVPVLFYAASLLALVVQTQSQAVVVWAWIFVAARVAHAIIHIAWNRIVPRMLSFFIGCVSVFAMWIVIVNEISSK